MPPDQFLGPLRIIIIHHDGILRGTFFRDRDRNHARGFDGNVPTDGIDKLVFELVLNVDEEVGRWPVVGLFFAVNFDFGVLDFTDVFVVIFSPHGAGEVVNVDPVVAGVGTASVDEDGVQAVWEVSKVGKLAVDVGRD